MPLVSPSSVSCSSSISPTICSSTSSMVMRPARRRIRPPPRPCGCARRNLEQDVELLDSGSAPPGAAGARCRRARPVKQRSRSLGEQDADDFVLVIAVPEARMPGLDDTGEDFLQRRPNGRDTICARGTMTSATVRSVTSMAPSTIDSVSLESRPLAWAWRSSSSSSSTLRGSPDRGPG